MRHEQAIKQNISWQAVCRALGGHIPDLSKTMTYPPLAHSTLTSSASPSWLLTSACTKPPSHESAQSVPPVQHDMTSCDILDGWHNSSWTQENTSLLPAVQRDVVKKKESCGSLNSLPQHPAHSDTSVLEEPSVYVYGVAGIQAPQTLAHGLAAMASYTWSGVSLDTRCMVMTPDLRDMMSSHKNLDAAWSHRFQDEGQADCQPPQQPHDWASKTFLSDSLTPEQAASCSVSGLAAQDFPDGLDDPALSIPSHLLDEMRCPHTTKPAFIFCARSDHPERVQNLWHQAYALGARCLITVCPLDDDMKMRLAEGTGQPFIAVHVSCIDRAVHALYPLFYPHLYPHWPGASVAVTGTNGKTSVVHFLGQLWRACGHTTVEIGTLGTYLRHASGNNLRPALSPQAEAMLGLSYTTPPCDRFHQVLDSAWHAGIRHAAWESSSHGFVQKRTWPVQARIGIWTSFSQDHLDYHGSMEAYFASKCQLFAQIYQAVVLCARLPHHDVLLSHAQRYNLRVVWYGVQNEDEHKIDQNRSTSLSDEKTHDDQKRAQTNGPELTSTYHFMSAQDSQKKPTINPLTHRWVQFRVGPHTWQGPLACIAPFQVENILAALTAAWLQGESWSLLCQALPHIQPVPGRMQLAGQRKQAAIYVDYAHTPDALKQALLCLRQIMNSANTLGVVFGCGGNRDASKRLLMGQVAAAYADWIIITDDNPRWEDSDAIRQAIIQGIHTVHKASDVHEIPHRAHAIQAAIDRLNSGDILLVAGKGHEQGQTIQGHTIPFCDVNIIAQYLENPTKF